MHGAWRAAASLWIEARHVRVARLATRKAEHARRVEKARARLGRARAWNDLLAVRRDTDGSVWWVESLTDARSPATAMMRPAGGGFTGAVPVYRAVPTSVCVVVDPYGDVVAMGTPREPTAWLEFVDAPEPPS